MSAPKKYININGVMKMNPEYKKWKASSDPSAPSAPVMTNAAHALPIVSNMDDHRQLNLIASAPFAPSTTSTMQAYHQKMNIDCHTTLTSDQAQTLLGDLFAKYEVPMGLLDKLYIISEYELLEFLIDDSGSMRMMSDTIDPNTQQSLTRWGEACMRLKEMIEILAYVPFGKIEICFLNRNDRLELYRGGMDPLTFYGSATNKIDHVFREEPYGSTPFFERLKDSFDRNAGKSVMRYFFGDGVPNGGDMAQKQIVKLLVNRPNPRSTPMTFLSCNSNDAEIEWMKEAEELAPYASECDDYKGEAKEVLYDQGVAFPYSKGFYLIASLVAACFPDDLDAMDESAPMTKYTLDNLLGIQHNDESYKYYFDSFLKAQRDQRMDQSSPVDRLKRQQNWQQYYSEFLNTPGPAKNIAVVQQYLSKLTDLTKSTRSAAAAGTAHGGKPRNAAPPQDECCIIL